MTDRRTERVAGYIRHEHANSYAVETGGWTDMFSNKRKQTNKQLQETSRQQLLEVMGHSLSKLQDRVQKLEHLLESASRTIYPLHKEVEYLQEQVRQQTKQYNKWYVEMYKQLLKIEEFVKEQQDMNKHSAGTIDAIQKVVLKIPGVKYA